MTELDAILNDYRRRMFHLRIIGAVQLLALALLITGILYIHFSTGGSWTSWI